MKPRIFAAVLLIVKVWDAVNDPIFGYIFDKVKFKNGLKSLPWLRISVVLIPFVTIAVFAIPDAGENLKLIWFGVAYLLWDTVYTLTDVPAYSMLNTMTDNLEERNLLLSVNRVFSGAGYLLCSVMLPLLPNLAVYIAASEFTSSMGSPLPVSSITLPMNSATPCANPSKVTVLGITFSAPWALAIFTLVWETRLSGSLAYRVWFLKRSSFR